MTYKSYAKINLSLDVTGKREDGYHLLKMVMQSISLYDEIEINLTDEPGVHLTTNKSYIPQDNRNIAKKAAEEFLLKSGINKGVRIHIEKNIPVAAGLAGGSTNGATVLRVLNKLTGYPLTEAELLNLGLSLGADIPFTMIGGTALCEGIGEIITQQNDFKGHTLLLIKPPFGISTGTVFKELDIKKIRIHPDTKSLLKYISLNSLNDSTEFMKNVLENVSLKKHPVIRKIKGDLLRTGSLNAVMSGSGPSIFGFFEDEDKAAKALTTLKLRNPETFILKTISKEKVEEGWQGV